MKSVPHIEGLTVEIFIWFIKNKCEDALDYLPDDFEERSINRQWLANLLEMFTNIFLGNTLNEDDFKEMISESIKNKEKFILEKHGMKISADTRIIKSFEKTSMLSSNKIDFI